MPAGARPKRKNRYDCFDDFVARLLRKKARQLIEGARLAGGDEEDVQQDLAVDLWRRLEKYDPTKASSRTFATRVINNGIATLLAARRAECRDYRLEEQLPDDDVEDAESPIPVMTKSEAAAAAALLSELLALREDVGSAKKRLTPSQRKLCAQLSSATISDVAGDTETPRSTLYGQIAEIRRQFERAGLRAYLGSDTFPGSPVCTGRRKA